MSYFQRRVVHYAPPKPLSGLSGFFGDIWDALVGGVTPAGQLQTNTDSSVSLTSGPNVQAAVSQGVQTQEVNNLNDLATQHGGVLTPSPLTPGQQNPNSLNLADSLKTILPQGVDPTAVLVAAAAAGGLYFLTRKRKRR